MTSRKIEPLIIGRGMAGQALHHALTLFSDEVAPAVWMERGGPLPEPEDPGSSLLVVAGPHALHAPRLLEAADRGYRYAICEKPAAVDLDQVQSLEGLPVATWICHGYRMLWGPAVLRQAVADGRFGEIFAVEGRYWQSSATRAPGSKGWKDDVGLGGRFDVLLDLAIHWADLVTFVSGRMPTSAALRRWYVNAASPHRDTHVHLSMQHDGLTSLGSISKTVHGTGNMLEMTVLGDKASASWAFLNPDVVVWGDGPSQRTEVRSAAELPTRLAPFHGLGWMEGYARIVGQVVEHMRHGTAPDAAELGTHLELLRCLLETAGAEKAR